MWRVHSIFYTRNPTRNLQVQIWEKLRNFRQKPKKLAEVQNDEMLRNIRNFEVQNWLSWDIQSKASPKCTKGWTTIDKICSLAINSKMDVSVFSGKGGVCAMYNCTCATIYYITVTTLKKLETL